MWENFQCLETVSIFGTNLFFGKEFQFCKKKCLGKIPISDHNFDFFLFTKNLYFMPEVRFYNCNKFVKYSAKMKNRGYFMV